MLGAGRSGTSLLAGLFGNSCYFAGDNLWPVTKANPAGYFEDAEINSINEDLLDKVVPWRPRGIIGAALPILRSRTRWSQRWLATVPEGTEIRSTHTLNRRIKAQTDRRPYLFKDPRFCHTLAAWGPYLAKDTVFLCVFREPQFTVNSIIKIVRDERYLRDLRVTEDRAYLYWEAMYRGALYQRQLVGGEWIFVHYDELLTQRAIPFLEDHLGVSANLAIIRPGLNRSTVEASVGESADSLCRTLLELAETKYKSLPRVGPVDAQARE